LSAAPVDEIPAMIERALKAAEAAEAAEAAAEPAAEAPARDPADRGRTNSSLHVQQTSSAQATPCDNPCKVYLARNICGNTSPISRLISHLHAACCGAVALRSSTCVATRWPCPWQRPASFPKAQNATHPAREAAQKAQQPPPVIERDERRRGGTRHHLRPYAPHCCSSWKISRICCTVAFEPS